MEARELEGVSPAMPEPAAADAATNLVTELSSPLPSTTPAPPASSAPAFFPSAPVPDPPVSGLPMSVNMDLGIAPMVGSGGSSGEDLSMKKRGRPRKYEADDSMALALCPVSPDSSGAKRGRGRPKGSGSRQLLATLGDWFAFTAGGNFIPHVVTVPTGEDVTARILSFSQKGPRAVCILSANGAISNVTLRQPGSSGGTLTYEGRFEILSLSGSFTIAENGGARSSRAGGISVSLAGPDGRVVGGGVAGSLLAASPIQVVVGSFMPNTLKELKKKANPEPSSYTPIQTKPPLLTAARPISQATPNDDCPNPNSATITGHNHDDDTRHKISSYPDPNITSFRAPARHGLQSAPDRKPSPDINKAPDWQGLQSLPEHKPAPDINKAPSWHGLQSPPQHNSSPDINIGLPGE